MYYVVVANASNSTTYLYIIYNLDCNIMLQNEEVYGNTINSSSEASGVNHIIHRMNNDLFSTRVKPELKTWYYHALLSYVTILPTK